MTKQKSKQQPTPKNAQPIQQPKLQPTLDTFQTTADLQVPEKIHEQIIGQERAVNVARKAATQKRNILLIGTPGTGKSLIAQAISELLPATKLEDVLIYQNHEDENQPIVKILKAGEGQKTLSQTRNATRLGGTNANLIMILVIIAASFILLTFGRPHLGDVITAAMLIGLFVIAAMMAFAMQMGKTNKLFTMLGETETPKLLIDNQGNKKAPFQDGSGAKAGNLLGDVRHDPLQSLLGTAIVKISSKKAANGKQSNYRSFSFEELWFKMAKKYPKLVEKHPNNYEAIVLPKKEKVYTLGFKDGKITTSQIYSLNRYFAEKELVELITNKHKLKLTSEHKLITPRGDKTAKQIKTKQDVIVLD